MLKFAYASIDENGKTSGGKQGDQTGREIKVANAYNFGQTKVLHCKNMVKRHRIAKLAVTVANNPAYGYSQGKRHTGYNYIMELVGMGIKSPLKKIAKNKKQYDFDCSSFVSAAVNFAYKKPKIGLCYTGNMEHYVSMLKGNSGKKLFRLRSYKKGMHIYKGDIILRPYHHVVVAACAGKAV